MCIQDSSSIIHNLSKRVISIIMLASKIKNKK
jgi:hypothetical protein